MTEELSQMEEALEGAKIPDATECMEEAILICLSVPMKNPNDADCPMGMPLFIWGPPGAGKSRRVEQAAEKLELPLETIYPGTKMPEDFNDLPVVIKDELRKACMMTAVNTLNEKKKGIIFTDETSLAVPAVQGAMLPFVLDRVCGSTRIHPQIRHLLAGNPPRYAAGGFALASPFANRMLHIYVQRPSRAKLIKYITTEGTLIKVSLARDSEKVKSKWSREWAIAKGQWAGFIKVCTEDAYGIDPDPENPQSGYCWSSPRSWEMAFRVRATAKCLGKDDTITEMLMEASVGEGPVIEFVEWLDKADLPDPYEVLKKQNWKIDEDRLDRSLAVATACTAAVTGETVPAEQIALATGAWKLFDKYLKVGMADAVLDHADSLSRVRLGAKHKNKQLADAAQAVLYEFAKDPSYQYAKDP